jgi:hypothetical protein
MLGACLLVFLDLAAVTPARLAVRGLQLTLTVEGGAIRGGGEQVHVHAELKNVSKKPLRAFWQPAGDSPLSLILDGKTHPMPPGIPKAAISGYVDLEPGESVRDSKMVIMAVGEKHKLSWRYSVDKDACDGCWTGTITTPAITMTAP